MTTGRQALARAVAQLKQSKISHPALDAEILLSFLWKKRREDVLAHEDDPLPPALTKKFTGLLKRRSRGEPLAYIVQRKDFYGLAFYVNKDVLVPRPETELLIEEAQRIIRGSPQAIVIDIGTGSGCLAITLAKLCAGALIYATDISADALAVARRNSRRHKVASKIKFYQGDLCAPLPREIWAKKQQKIIIANLPYLRDGYKRVLVLPENRALRYEPEQALFAGRDGLKYYTSLFDQLKRIHPFSPPADLLLEIDPRQKLTITRKIKYAFPSSRIQCRRDLAGRTRAVLASILEAQVNTKEVSC